MNIITLDFETYFDDDYSLKKMTTESYIRDPRFEVLGVAIRYPIHGGVEWRRPPFDQEELMIWQDSALLCHHSQFDGLILSHHYGVKPRVWLDTLSMARLKFGNHLSVSLAALAQHFGLAAKNVPYDLFKGKHWDELPPHVQRQVGDGACHDVDLTWSIFQELAKGFPAEEYQVIDTTIRMFTEPVATANLDQLRKVWADDEQRRRDLLASVGADVKELRSDDKFAELLMAEGVTPEKKQGKNGPIWAFAKTDAFMKGLEEHENERVQALAAARLGTKTSILQSRAVRMAHMAQRGPLCIYLSYAGAHTSRFSGGDKLNFQNPPPSLKKAIEAPAGHKFAIADASQIECRILNTLAGQWDVVERFKNGEDPYVNVASTFYGYAINKKDHPEERQVGKVLELQCGFGSGAAKIKSTLRIRAGILLSDDDSLRARDAYRNTHPNVVSLWRGGDSVLDRLHGFESSDWLVFKIRCDAKTGHRRIVLPNGIELIYDTLEWYTDEESGERYWRIRTREGYAKMYGAKLIENLVQALARIIVTAAMNRIKAAGIRIVTMTHDDVVCLLLDDANIHDKFAVITNEMKRTPAWMPDLPLDCEAVISGRYEK